MKHITKNKVIASIFTFLVLIVAVMIYGDVTLSEPQKHPIYVSKPRPTTVEPSRENKKNTQISKFDLEFLKIENEEKNMIYSPLSLEYALNMLRDGSDGKTKDELDKLLGNKALKKYIQQEQVLSLANSIFIRDTYRDNVKESYIDNLYQNYDADVMFDKFKNASNINKWIKEKTFEIIPKMLEDSQVQDPEVKMLIINALAIDMEWAVKFDSANTHGREFTKSNGETVDVTTMHLLTTDLYTSYYKDDDYTILKKDLGKYNDVELEFAAIQPMNLNYFISKSSSKDINKLLDKAKKIEDENTRLNIYIPKFEYEYNLQAKEDLQKMGLRTIFEDGNADLSKITDDSMYVEDIKHKAKIEFSEDGIKAAAVTVVSNKVTSIVTPVEYNDIDIIFDHPFLYLIKDKNSDTTWFIGTVYEPNLWKSDRKTYESR